jgi:hypothetical protein
VTSFAVVTCGFEPAGLSAHPAVAASSVLPHPTDESFLDHAIDLLRGATSEVVVLYPPGRESRRRVQVVQAAVRAENVRAVSVGRALTGLSGAAAVLTTMAAWDVPAGIAVGQMLERGPALLPTYAAATSVAAFDDPHVRLSHHVLSWLPGTVFTITLAKDVHISTGAVRAEAPPEGGVDVVTAGEPRLASRLRSVTPQDAVEWVELAPTKQNLWGGARYFEQTLVPRDVSGLLAGIDQLTQLRCAQCGSQVTGPCPFCTSREAQPS